MFCSETKTGMNTNILPICNVRNQRGQGFTALGNHHPFKSPTMIY